MIQELGWKHITPALQQYRILMQPRPADNSMHTTIGLLAAGPYLLQELDATINTGPIGIPVAHTYSGGSSAWELIELSYLSSTPAYRYLSLRDKCSQMIRPVAAKCSLQPDETPHQKPFVT